MDQYSKERIDRLLARYLAGECTMAERQEVAEWIGASEANSQYFDRFAAIWTAASSRQRDYMPDVESGWQKVKSRMQDTAKGSAGKNIEMLQSRRSILKIWWKVAAVLVAAVGLTTMIWQLTDQPEEVMITHLRSTAQPVSDTLSDGTLIDLNKQSSLEFPAVFPSDIREVSLSGEAFFEVAEDTSRPFIIRTKGAEIRVVGTAFNVSAYPANELVEVTVQSGTVQMTAGDAGTEVLTAGIKGIYQKKDKKIRKMANNNPGFLFWKGRTLVFKKTKIDKVVEILNDLYAVEIDIKTEALKSCQLSATFKDESIDNILDIISMTFDLTITRNNRKIELTGDGC